MSEKKQRRRWTPQRKLEIVLESLQSDQKTAEICRREGIAPTMLYQWRKQLLGAAESIYARKENNPQEDRRLAQLSSENQRMKSVIAEITAENLDLKKTLSD